MTAADEIKARWAMLRADRTMPAEMDGDVVRTDGVPKTAGIAKGLLAGLLGVGDFSPEIIARQVGKGVRRSALPVGAAGGTALALKKKKGEEKTAGSRLASLKRRRFGGITGYDQDGEKLAADEVKQDELNTLIDRTRAKSTLKAESHVMKTAFWSGFGKLADVSKEELRSELKKHEERETPEQEAAETPREQKIEREAGVEKGAGAIGRVAAHLDRNADRYLAGIATGAAVSSAKSRHEGTKTMKKRAFYEGFEKKAITFNVKHNLDVGKDVADSLGKLRNLRAHHLAAGGLAAGAGLGFGHEAGKRVASIGKKTEPKLG